MDDVYDLYRRGTELLEAGHHHQAAVPLSRARDLAPDKTSVREALGRALFHMQHYDEAADEFRAVIERAPTNDYALFCLGRCLQLMGRHAEARQPLALAATLRPNRSDYRVYRDRARARAAEGQPALSGSRVTIRPAQPDDAAPVAALVAHAYARYIPRIGRRPAPMDDDYPARIAAGQASVAEDRGAVVGVIVLVPAEDHLLVDNIAVARDRHGHGIGRALLDHADAVAAELGLPELRLYTHVTMTENRAIYPRLGFRETGRRTVHGYDRVFFARTVRGGEAPCAGAF